jgi:hypothetical protein
MWEYWRGKYGHVDALEEYYADLLASDPRLISAVAQLRNAKAAIDARMAELETQEQTP